MLKFLPNIGGIVSKLQTNVIVNSSLGYEIPALTESIFDWLFINKQQCIEYGSFSEYGLSEPKRTRRLPKLQRCAASIRPGCRILHIQVTEIFYWNNSRADPTEIKAISC